MSSGEFLHPPQADRWQATKNDGLLHRLKPALTAPVPANGAIYSWHATTMRMPGTPLAELASMPTDETIASCDLTRREALSAISLAAAPLVLGSETVASAADTGTKSSTEIALHINGKPIRLTLDPRSTLLDLLREQLGLTGTKKGCDHGQCGACTVLVQGRRVNSCLTLAATHDGQEITTVEGLARPARLDPIQTAFIDHDAFQCGYCTPGQICSASALIGEWRRGDASFVTADLTQKHPVELSDDEIRERMSGNICRCGAYPGIVAAVREAAHAGSRPSHV
jgi:xanthine dehydrogenase YagT iron-sulfur-binding subunit